MSGGGAAKAGAAPAQLSPSSPPPRSRQVARDIDGSGNYLLLTSKHVAQLPPPCGYRLRQAPPPPWLLYHEFTISLDNCLSVVSEIEPEM